MHSISLYSVLLLALFGSSLGVTVSDGGYSFSLESVKVLKRLMELEARDASKMEVDSHGSRSRLANHHYTPGRRLCNNPTLPQELKAVCMEPQADEVFSRFVTLTTPTDPCEICANPACTDCIY